LAKPDWNPPGWLFGPVWTFLYILMGLALYLIWKSSAPRALKRPAILLWSCQMGLNFLWSFLFFNQHMMAVAFYEIVLLWLLILLTIFAFARIHKVAAWLLVPYISWVSFAAMLNYTIWQLNA
jgi:translocator protein